MDKLRKYIQECWGDIVYSDYDKVATLEDLEYNYRYIRFLLSTEAMFIKRLVENDKIDRKKFYEKNILKWFVTITKEEKADSIIMNLSISDTPIDDLVSYLKNV